MLVIEGIYKFIKNNKEVLPDIIGNITKGFPYVNIKLDVLDILDDIKALKISLELDSNFDYRVFKIFSDDKIYFYEDVEKHNRIAMGNKMNSIMRKRKIHRLKELIENAKS